MKANTLRPAALTSTPPQQARSILDLFDGQVTDGPDRLAIRHADQTLTYAQASERVARLAGRLHGLGVGPGCLVGLLVHRSVDVPVALLAILKTGAGYVPIDASHPVSRIAQVIEDARPKILLTTGDLGRRAPGGEGVAQLDLAEALGNGPPWDMDGQDVVPPLSPAPDSIAYVIFTSGSTGRPKGVQIPHRALVNFALSMIEEPGLGPSDRVLGITTLSFDIAVLEMLVPLCAGASIDLLDRDVAVDGMRLRQRLEQDPPTVMQATPATWRMLVDAGWMGHPGMRLLTGGEALPTDLARQLLSRGSQLWNLYGPTETTVWSTLHRVTRDPGSATVPIGHAVRETSLYVLDPALRPVVPGQIGELFIGGQGVALGYHGRDDLTAERFVADPFTAQLGARMYRTGDLASFAPDGTTLHFHGRADRQIKLRGHRIEPAEIEGALRALPPISDAVVMVRAVGVDERLVAYVVTRDGAPLPTSSELRAQLVTRLPESMLPAHYVRLDRWPLTPSGKVDQGALPPPTATAASDDGSAGAAGGRSQDLRKDLPRDDVELTIAVIWQDLLGVRQIGRDDDFFELGGHSLLAVRAQAALARAFTLDVPLTALFECRTVARMAAMLDERRTTQPSLLPPNGRVLPLQPRGEGLPLIFVCGIQIYHELALAVGEQRPSYGIFLPVEGQWLEAQAAGVEPQPLSVHDMATSYVEVIRRHQPHGPYALAGLSFGGVLAFEIAHRLRDSGEEVALLALLDSLLPGARRRALVPWLGSRLEDMLRPGSGGLRATAKRGLARVQRRLRGPAAAVPTGAATGDLSEPALRALRDRLYGEAIARHEPRLRPYPGRVMFFRALDREESFGWHVDPDGGWRRLVTGSLELIDVPGDHTGIVVGASAQLVGGRLRRELDRLSRRQPAAVAGAG